MRSRGRSVLKRAIEAKKLGATAPSGTEVDSVSADLARASMGMLGVTSIAFHDEDTGKTTTYTDDGSKVRRTES